MSSRLSALTWAVGLGGALLSPAAALAQANLTLDQLTVAPAGVAGGRLTVTLEVLVSGVRAPFSWAAYLSTTGALDGARSLGTFGPVTPSADGRLRVQADVTLPADVGGQYFVLAELDPAGALADANPYDDVLGSDARVRVAPRSAELSLRSVRALTARARAGDPVTLEVTVENTGAVAADVALVGLADRDGTLSSSDGELGRATARVEAGATATAQLAGRVPAGAAPGRYTVGVRADPDGAVVERDESNNLMLSATGLTVFEESLTIDTADLPAGAVFQRYYARLDAHGGDGTFQYTVTRGRLPPGLSLGFASGVISGAPLGSGTFELTIEARSDRVIAERTFTIDVAESGVELAVVTPDLPIGTLGLPYDAELGAAGGEPPYRWTVLSGALAPGLDLATDGRITGRPTADGTFGFEVEVRDALGGRVRTSFELRIDPANVFITSVSLPAMNVGEPARVELTVKGGAAPYSWTALSAPPPGLTLDEEGVLSGTPSRVGRFATRVRVEDGTEHPHQDTALVIVEVVDSGMFALSVPEIPRLGLRQNLLVTLAVEGGKPPYQWRVDPRDELPEGFLFEPAALGEGEATLRGYSIRPIDRAFTVEVTDKTGRTRSAIVAIHVDPAAATGAGGCACMDSPPSARAPWLVGLAALGWLWTRRRR